MKNPSYLVRSRHGVLYFRWPLPQHLRVAGKTDHVKVSLRTREPKEALRLANVLGYHAHVLTQHEVFLTMDHGDIIGMLKGYFYELIDQKKAEIHKHGPLPPRETQALVDELERVQEAIAQDRDEIPGEDMHKRLAPVIARYDVDIPQGSEDYKNLQKYYMHAFLGFCEKVLSHNQKQLDFPFTTLPGYLNAMNRNGAFPQPGNRLEKVIEKYKAEMKRSEAWGIRAEEEREDCLNLLVELAGGKTDIAKIDVAEARNVKEVLSRLPANRNKLKETRGLPVLEQIEVPGLKPLSVGSVNKYMQVFSGLFKWAVSNGYTTLNPFSGLMLKEKGKKKRDLFKPDQVQLILAEVAKGKKDLLNSDMKYWGLMIGLYTGARLNEIASLTPEDVKQDKETGIWFFDINDEEEQKRLKTEAAKRRVPVHSALIEAGLIEYVQQVAEKHEKGARLLHALSFSEKEGWGRKLGRWFNNTFLPKLELKKPGLSFHSLRHTVITNLRRAGVDNHNVRALVGHEPDGVTEEVYMHDLGLVQLRKDVECLRYE